MHHLMIMVSSAASASATEARLAVIAERSKGYDLDRIWKQVDPAWRRMRSAVTSGNEGGGEPPDRW
jgi:hypothetical protein